MPVVSRIVRRTLSRAVVEFVAAKAMPAHPAPSASQPTRSSSLPARGAAAAEAAGALARFLEASTALNTPPATSIRLDAFSKKGTEKGLTSKRGGTTTTVLPSRSVRTPSWNGHSCFAELLSLAGLVEAVGAAAGCA